MATFTSSLATAGAPVKSQYAGPTKVAVKMVQGGGTLSDIYLLAKVPNGALITAFYGTGSVGGNADAAMKFGWKAQATTSEAAFGTHSFSATTDPGKFDMLDDNISRVLVSFSDSTGDNFAWIYATASTGTFSDSISLEVNLEFILDHNEFAF